MRSTRLSICLAACALGLSAGKATAGEVLLQYFESSWETIERRMPDVFMAGYDAIWVPPPGRADSGGFSVGYDVFNRFEFGNGNSRTLYGTEQGFTRLSDEFDTAGISLYIDAVLNHNGFRDGSTPGFEASGGYPGFVTTADFDVDGDFHGIFEGGDLRERLAGLIDINQSKNYVFTRHPVPGEPNNIPNETPLESNRQFYPDRDLPQEFGRHPFNLNDPLAGDPIQENSVGLLLRYMQYMVEVHGVDGFRLDATKHIPTFFFNDFYDAALFNLGRNPIDNSPFTPFSFGENFTGNFDSLNAYVRKDGFGNRDTLDFPLFFAMDSIFGAGGFGDMRGLEFASYDSSDGNANDGSRGVMFAGSHDSNGAGAFNGYNNLAQAHILTRTGFPLVYYNAKEFGEGRDFPKDGRGDALGNFGDTLINLLRVNDEYIRGPHATRWIDADTYVYERQNAALIALNDRADVGFDSRTVQTAFAPGTVLVEVTGNATDAFVDPNDDIFDSVTVNDVGQVTIRVPRMSSSSGFHAKGYVVYGPKVPDATFTIANASGVILPDPDDGRPQAVRRLSTIDIVTSDTINLNLVVENSPAAGNDNALVKVNFGQVDVDGDSVITPTGEFAGFESFPSVTNDSATNTYSAVIDASQLADGYNYFETVSFRSRAAGSPPLYNVERRVVYLDRLPPEHDLLFPSVTGTDDITSRDYEAVVRVDPTVNSVHVIRGINGTETDEQILALVSGENAARKFDRLEYRYLLTDLLAGTLNLAVVGFEQTGNYSIKRYTGIGVDVPVPDVFIGRDTNLLNTATTFSPLPNQINTAALQEDIVIRVRTANIDGEGRNINFPADYRVSLTVDGDAPIEAVPFNAALLPPVGRLVQNDQALGDEFDEFRFLWRGYSRGAHSFVAEVELLDQSEPANQALAQVFVEQSTPGPLVTLLRPAAAGETLTNPDEVEVVISFNDNLATYAQVFFGDNEEQTLLQEFNNLSSGVQTITRPVGSYVTADRVPTASIKVQDGVFPVRVLATTGANGSGIATELSANFTVEGLSALPVPVNLAVDGDGTDLLTNGLLLAASAADGGAGDGLPADFGADGTLTELFAKIQGNTLYVAIRGDMFGSDTPNFDNGTYLFIDVDGGQGTGVTNTASLADSSDGLRSNISNTNFALSPSLVSQGFGFDAVVGITSPTIAFGYTFGSGGLGGSTANFEFVPGIAVAYDENATEIPPAPGATIAAPNVIEIAIPLADLGNPVPENIRLAAVTSSDLGYASPNTLPENSSNAFGPNPNAQTLEELAGFNGFGLTPVINEVFIGDDDWFELYNPSSNRFALSDWTMRLYDSEDLVFEYTFPQGAVIEANGYYVVSDEGKANPPAISAYADAVAGFNFIFDEERGGALALINPVGVGADYVAWLNATGDATTAAGVLPYGTNFEGTISGPASRAQGQSLGRNAVSTDTDNASDWDNTSGADATLPTPGAANSNAAFSTNALWFMY
ncbi:MAG: lamin tail domain-containing protein [Sumerlaeia bacterium]